MMRRLALLHPTRATVPMVLGLLVAGAPAEVRYVPPTHDIVVNAAVVARAGQTVHLPVYFSDAGRYYAELLPEGTRDLPQGGLAALGVSVRIARGHEVLLERAFSGGPPGKQTGTTILWLEVPGDLPQRRELDLALAFDTVPAALAGKTLRFQLTRKIELPPLRPFP